MSRSHAVMLAVLTVILVGCTTTRRYSEDFSLQTPVKIELGKPGAPAGPIRLRSGQMMNAVFCCPSLELRDGHGTVVREFAEHTPGQRLDVPAGTYSLVGHDPEGKECVLQLKITSE
jgi:hypothetical protein